MRRYAPRDDQWERIRDLLPGREDTVGVTAVDNRLFVEAVLYFESGSNSTARVVESFVEVSEEFSAERR